MKHDQFNSGKPSSSRSQVEPMQLPLFPLNTVLFPGMVLPLHIFEPRYREMVHYCLQEQQPFGVVHIRQGLEAGPAAIPHEVGTAARITKADRLPDGRMDIHAVGTRRFRILELNREHSYLSATVSHYPVLNGDTVAARHWAQQVRPRLIQYVDLLTQAAGVELRLDRLPEDPTTLAFLVGIAIQISPTHKQKLLEQAGIPEILEWENYYLGKELKLLAHMVETQPRLPAMTSGPTGQLFPN